MLFKELQNKWLLYPKTEYQDYHSSLKSGIWDDPAKNIEEKVDFLNGWRTRIDRSTAIPGLQNITGQFKTKLAFFSSLELVENDINERNVFDIYSLLLSVDGLGPIGASKILHMHQPSFFMMWDSQIFRDYFHIKTVLKSTATPRRYFLFLKRMKAEMTEAVNDYARTDRQGNALSNFRAQFNSETIARIADKFNYVTRGTIKDN